MLFRSGFLDIEKKTDLIEILNEIDLITPNSNEAQILFTDFNFTDIVCSVLLKGGHNIESIGTDYLFHDGKNIELTPNQINLAEKHGSGCVLSSAIAAQLALGNNIPEACEKAKRYIETFLQSNTTKLGYHYV